MTLRIDTPLQGRAEKGDIYLLKGDWNEKFIDQAISFPSKYVHDDLVDSLAYIDQLVPETLTNFDITTIEKDTAFQMMDERAGY